MTNYKQKVKSLNDQIAKVKNQIEIEQHRYIRQKNSLKRQTAKERNHRMIFCTGRIEYSHSLHIIFKPGRHLLS